MTLWLAAGWMLLLSSCTPQWLFQHKDIPYHEEYSFSPDNYEHLIQPDDKITLSIWGHEELGVGSTFSIYSSNLEQGKYLIIDRQGEVSLPLIGKVKLSGLTAREADLYLRQLYAKYVINPIIYLRVLSHTVTVLGEVKTPGNYLIDKQVKSLIEILGDAGGFTDYADASVIKIIRNHPVSMPEEITVDLTDMETLSVSSLALRRGDIIYIPERRGKRFEQVLTGKIVPIVGAIGSIAIALSLINNSSK